MQSQLDKLKRKVTKGEDLDTISSFYYLIKELGCLPEVIGRDYEVEYDKQNRIKKIRQLPMKITTLVTLFREMKKDWDEQNKRMRKINQPRKK